MFRLSGNPAQARQLSTVLSFLIAAKTISVVAFSYRVCINADPSFSPHKLFDLFGFYQRIKLYMLYHSNFPILIHDRYQHSRLPLELHYEGIFFKL
jgi:hypothetical protein